MSSLHACRHVKHSLRVYVQYKHTLLALYCSSYWPVTRSLNVNPQNLIKLINIVTLFVIIVIFITTLTEHLFTKANKSNTTHVIDHVTTRISVINNLIMKSQSQQL